MRQINCAYIRTDGVRCHNKEFKYGYCRIHQFEANKKNYQKKNFNITVPNVIGRIRSKKDMENQKKFYEYIAR